MLIVKVFSDGKKNINQIIIVLFQVPIVLALSVTVFLQAVFGWPREIDTFLCNLKGKGYIYNYHAKGPNQGECVTDLAKEAVLENKHEQSTTTQISQIISGEEISINDFNQHFSLTVPSELHATSYTSSYGWLHSHFRHADSESTEVLATLSLESRAEKKSFTQSASDSYDYYFGSTSNGDEVFEQEQYKLKHYVTKTDGKNTVVFITAYRKNPGYRYTYFIQLNDGKTILKLNSAHFIQQKDIEAIEKIRLSLKIHDIASKQN